MDKSQPRICIPVCANSISTLQAELTHGAQLADFVEVRVDCLKDFELSALEKISELTAKLQSNVIITFRPREQGGHREIDPALRQQFWKQCGEVFTRELFDIELDLVTSEGLSSLDWQRVICSYHDFSGVPSNLAQIYETMAATPARYLKIAIAARDTVDCLPVFDLIDRAKRANRQITGIAMGIAGVATRILGRARGSHLTYAAADAETRTAPGQIEVQTLREIFHVDSLSPATQVMGLVGAPVAHSLSPVVHNKAFLAAGLDAVYIPFEVHDLDSFFERMVYRRSREIDWNLRGLSVTAPHKAAVMRFVDSLDSAAAEIGAVNTITVDEKGLRGYNTDAMAVLKPIEEKIGSLKDTRCAVIGAGGAANASLWSLRQQGARVTVFSRNETKAQGLATHFQAASAPLRDASFAGFDVVINATPLGTAGTAVAETPATVSQLRGARLAYDLVYNPSDTLFLHEARAAGCETVGGLSMLVLQAVEQFKLWTGKEAPLEVMWREAKSKA